MRSIFSITRKDLEEYFLSINEKKFKATQVFEWIYRTKWLDNAKMSRMIGVIVNNRQESEYFRGTFLTASVLM